MVDASWCGVERLRKRIKRRGALLCTTALDIETPYDVVDSDDDSHKTWSTKNVNNMKELQADPVELNDEEWNDELILHILTEHETTKSQDK